MSANVGHVLVLGTNHRLAPVEFRERLAFLPDETPDFLRRAHAALSGSDCFLLSTCNRTEFYAVSGGDALQDVLQLLAEFKTVDPHLDAPKFYQYRGHEAVEQLLRVASGLDSQLLGEPQILQQVREAFATSVRAQTMGVVGERLLEAGIRCGRRARSETEISHGAISIAYAAVSLSHKVFADLALRTALVIGVGETGALVARNLREHGIGRLLLANRTAERVRGLAHELRGELIELDELERVLPEADIVIAATNAPEPLVRRDMVRRAMKKHHHGSMLIVDIGVPRNVEPQVRQVDNVFLNDIDGMQAMIDQNLSRRRRAVPNVERIVHEEKQRFLDWHSGLQAGPLISELRAKLEELGAQEIARLHGLSSEQRAVAEQLTRSLLNKILHRPTKLLRDAPSQGDTGLRHVDAVRDIFGLGSTPTTNDPKKDTP